MINNNIIKKLIEKICGEGHCYQYIQDVIDLGIDLISDIKFVNAILNGNLGMLVLLYINIGWSLYLIIRSIISNSDAENYIKYKIWLKDSYRRLCSTLLKKK